jgi:hypothetical protein
MTIGTQTKSAATQQVIIGRGTGTVGQELQTAVAGALALGVNSNLPSILISPGAYNTYGNVSVGTTSTTYLINVGGSASFGSGADTIFTPDITDGASAVAYTFDTLNTLSTTGSKIAKFSTNGSQVAFIDNEGRIGIKGGNPTGLYGFIAAGRGQVRGVMEVINSQTGKIVSANMGTDRATWYTDGGLMVFSCTASSGANAGVAIGSNDRVGIGFVGTNLATLDVRSLDTAIPVIIARGAASQTANLQEWQNSSGTVLAQIEADGDFQTDGWLYFGASGAEMRLATGSGLIYMQTAAGGNPRIYAVGGVHAGTLASGYYSASDIDLATAAHFKWAATTIGSGQDTGIVRHSAGIVRITNASTGYGQIYALSAGIGTTQRGSLTPDVADGASAIGYTFDTLNTLSTTGAKIASFKNNTTEKVYITKDGDTVLRYLTSNGSLRLLGYTSSAAAPTTTELPADKDVAIHKDTNTGNVYLAYNDGGATIKSVQLT